MKKNSLNLDNYGVDLLSLNSNKNINGGFLLTLPLFAFAWGVAYGYAIESLESE